MSITSVSLDNRKNSSPHVKDLNLQEAVQRLVEIYQNQPLKRETVIDASRLLASKVLGLHKDRPFDKNFFHYLEDFCCLLCLPSVEVQNHVIALVGENIKQPKHLVMFVKNGWVNSLINLEKQVSKLLNLCLRENHSANILDCLDTYEYLIEQLFLFSLLSHDGEKRVQVEQHLQVAGSSSECWLTLLEKAGGDNNLIAEKALEVRSSFQAIRSRERTREFNECLNTIKGNLDNGYIHSQDIGDFCAEIGHWYHFFLYYQSCLESVISGNSSEKLKKIKIYLLEHLATVCMRHRRFGDAEAFYKKMYKLDRSALSHIPNEALAELFHLGSAPLSALSLIERDKQHSSESLDVIRNINSLYVSSVIHADLGNFSEMRVKQKLLFDNIGQMQSATKVDLVRLMKVMKHSFLVECSLGNIESAKEAKSIYEELLNIMNGIKDNDLKESNLLMEGCLHLVEGRFKEAIDFFEKLLSFQQNEPEKYVKTCPDDFYDMHAPEGLLSDQEQLKILQDSVKVADNLLVFNLSLAYGKNGEYQKAINLLEKTIPLCKTHVEDLSLARAYFYLGNLYSHLKDNLKAEKMFFSSLDFYKTSQSDLVPNKKLSITFFEERSQTISGMESVLLEQGEFEKALIYCDQKKADVLVTKMAQRLPHNTVGILPSEQLTFAQMQALAKEQNTVFVSYSFIKNLTSAAFLGQHTCRLYVFLIKPEGNLEYKELNITDLPEEVKSAESLFETFPYNPKKRLEEGKKPPQIECIERYACLYKVLLEPIEDVLPPREANLSLTFIPEGALAHISFAALKDKTGTYLIEKYPVVYAPSIRVLHLLGQMHPQFSDKALVVYNPTTPNKEDNKLKGTEKEVMEGVMPCFDQESIISLSEEGAKVTCIMDEMPKARWTHMACHGVANNIRANDSVFDGLFKLAADEKNQNGYLEAETIASLNLNAELVFLSACHSGRGNVMKEGTLGPNWSFLAAGSLSTVSTHWALPVNDISNEMIKIFYSHLFGINGVEKLDAARALQKATLYALAKNRKHLHQWAVFLLTGVNIGSSSLKTT